MNLTSDERANITTRTDAAMLLRFVPPALSIRDARHYLLQASLAFPNPDADVLRKVLFHVEDQDGVTVATLREHLFSTGGSGKAVRAVQAFNVAHRNG